MQHAAAPKKKAAHGTQRSTCALWVEQLWVCILVRRGHELWPVLHQILHGFYVGRQVRVDRGVRGVHLEY